MFFPIVPPRQYLPIEPSFVVVPNVTTFDSGAGNYEVEPYDTLTIEIWGAGAPGDSSNSTGFLGNPEHGTAGGASAVSTLSLSAGGAQANTGGDASTPATRGAGGTASGGNDTNTNGNQGGVDTGAGGGTRTAGFGAASPGGGGGQTGAPSSGPSGNFELAATSANAPGSGSSGTIAGLAANGFVRGFAGGSSGAYVKSVYVRGVTAGWPQIGSLLAYSVGVGGDNNAGNSNSRPGANGRIRITVG